MIVRLRGALDIRDTLTIFNGSTIHACTHLESGFEFTHRKPYVDSGRCTIINMPFVPCTLVDEPTA